MSQESEKDNQLLNKYMDAYEQQQTDEGRSQQNEFAGGFFFTSTQVSEINNETSEPGNQLSYLSQSQSHVSDVQSQGFNTSFYEQSQAHSSSDKTLTGSQINEGEKKDLL